MPVNHEKGHTVEIQGVTKVQGRWTRTRSLRMSLFFAALFLGLGVFVPFFPVWLSAQGLDATQISVVLACQMAVRIFAGPAFAFLADVLHNRRALLIALSLAALAGMVLLALVTGFLAILCLAVVASVMWTPILPLMESLAVAESEGGGPDYGRTRLWGSLSFILGSVGGGYILRYTSPDTVIWILVAAYTALAVSAFALPKDTGVRASSERYTVTKARFADVLPVVFHPVFLAVLCSVSLIQASHAFYYGFGTIHWQTVGIGDDVIGALWAVGVVSEVVLFAFARRTLSLVGPLGLILAGAAAALIRWCMTALEPDIGWLVVIQLGHALTFGATHLGAMHFIARAAPARYHATVQGIHAAFAGGIVMALVMSGSGGLYASYGAFGYLAMAALGAVGGILALGAAFRWDGGKL